MVFNFYKYGINRNKYFAFAVEYLVFNFRIKKFLFGIEFLEHLFGIEFLEQLWAIKYVFSSAFEWSKSSTVIIRKIVSQREVPESRSR